MELDERYRLVRFGEADEVNEGALIEFWDREGAIDTPEARRRVAEVAFVVVEDEAVAGLSTVFLEQSEGLKKRNEAVWPDDSRYTFIGENARGDHCRVYYFAGARVALPG